MDSLEFATGPSPSAAVIWLHGLGADGHDFEPIVPELHLPASAAVRFVFPHAPMPAVTINGGAKMRAWYDIDPRAPLAGEADIRASALEVEAIVAEQLARGIASKRI